MAEALRDDHWSDLIGAPWKLGGADPETGIDCWELVRLVCSRRGIEVPAIRDPAQYRDRQSIGAPDLSGWRQVAESDREPGDVAAYSLAGAVVDHVGVYVGGGLIVHSRADSGVVALPERFSRAAMRGWWRPGPAENPYLLDGHDEMDAICAIGDRSSGVVIVRVYRSILDLDDYQTHVCEWTGGAVAEYLPIQIPLGQAACSIDGAVLTRLELDTYRPDQGDLINLVATPGGPAIIVGLGGFASVAAAETAIGAVGFALLSFAVTSAISIGLSFLAGILLAPPQPPVDRSQVDQSPTFSQTGIRNTIAAGGVVPIVIGTHRVGGQIIGSYNSVGGLVVTPFSGTGTPTTPGGPFDLIQNTNSASAAGGKTTVNLLIAVSEGAIQAINGITTDVDDQPASTLAASTLLIDGNDAADYAGVTYSTRMGTSEQTVIPGFADTITAVGVERTLIYQQPWTYTTTTDVDGFAIQLFEPQGHFRIAASDGSTRQKTCTYTFQYRPVGATAWTQSMTITRGYINRAAHSWEIKIGGLARGKWEISLERTTHDDSSSAWQSGGSNNPQEVSLSIVNAVNEITEGGSAHGGIALIAVKAVASDQLSGVPTVTSLVKGKKWWVWDGLSETDPRFNFRWTDNPGEVLQGLLTNETFGLGKFIPLQRLRLSDLKSVADYCDEMIDDGRGGTMTRWRLDMVYDRSQKAGDLLDQIMACCRISMVVVAGKVGFRIDKTRTPTHLFSEGNVRDVRIGHVDITYQPSRINVQFSNEELDYDIDTVSVEDQTITDGEFVEETVTLLGCTKPARAMRFAQHRLNVSRTALKTLTFTATSSAVTLSPGDAFWFSHGELASTFASGILVGASSFSVRLDRDVIVDNSITYKLRVMYWKASTSDRVIDEFTMSTPTSGLIAAGTSILFASSIPGPSVPPTGTSGASVYAFGPSTDYVTPFIAISAPMDEGLDRTVSAIEYDAGVYDDDPGDVPSATDVLHEKKLIPAKVEGLRLSEQTRTGQSGDVRHVIAASWEGDYAFESADVWYRWPELDDFRSWTLLGRFHGQRAEIDAQGLLGVIAVSVCPVSPMGHSAHPERGATASLIVHGKLDRPEVVTGLVIADVQDGVLISWAEPDERDIASYEIRHGTTWPMARTLACVSAPACSARLMHDIPDGYAGDAVYMVKAINTSGRESPTAAEIAHAPNNSNVETVSQDEATSWTGTDTNMTLSSGTMVSDDPATSFNYTTAAIDTGAIADQIITAAIDAHLRDRDTIHVDDADWLVGGSGGSTRMVTPSVISDYPVDLRDHARTMVTGSGYFVDSALSQHKVTGPVPREEFTLTVEARVADTSGGLSAASWRKLTPEVQSFRWYQVRVSGTVPHPAYQAVFTELSTAAYIAHSDTFVVEEAKRSWLGAGGYNSPRFFNAAEAFISGWGFGRTCPDAASTTIAFKGIPIPKWAKADGSNYLYVDVTWTISATPGSDLAWVLRVGLKAYDEGDGDPGSGLTNASTVIPVTTSHTPNVVYRTTATITTPDIYSGGEEFLMFALYRLGTDGSDTYTGTVSVSGIEIRSGVNRA